MQYLVGIYWVWFVVAVLVGGAVGYWLRWRLGAQGGTGQVLRWGTVAFSIGLVVAVLHWLPQRPGFYLETLLLLSFWYALGGLLGALLRSVTSATGSSSAVLAGHALPDSAALARRARAAVKSAQDEAPASPGTIEDARLAVEAKATEVTRIVAAAKAADQERTAAKAKAAEAARLAAAAKAAEEARLAVDAKAAEVTRIAAAAAKAGKAAQDASGPARENAAEEARIAAAAKAVETAAAEAKAAEHARLAAAAKAAEDARVAAEPKAAEEARIAAATKAAEDARVVAEAKTGEEARIATAAEAAEQARVAAEAKTTKKARTGAAAKAGAEASLAAEARTRITAAAREAAAMMANGPGVAAVAAVAETGLSHPGSKPAGIAAPAEGRPMISSGSKASAPGTRKPATRWGSIGFARSRTGRRMRRSGSATTWRFPDGSSVNTGSRKPGCSPPAARRSMPGP